MGLCVPGAFAVALIKPQFEAGPEHVGKGGVVRDEGRACGGMCADCRLVGGLPGWRVLGVERSPITGPEGNVEFLIGAVRES